MGLHLYSYLYSYLCVYGATFPRKTRFNAYVHIYYRAGNCLPTDKLIELVFQVQNTLCINYLCLASLVSKPWGILGQSPGNDQSKWCPEKLSFGDPFVRLVELCLYLQGHRVLCHCICVNGYYRILAKPNKIGIIKPDTKLDKFYAIKWKELLLTHQWRYHLIVVTDQFIGKYYV